MITTYTIQDPEDNKMTIEDVKKGLQQHQLKASGGHDGACTDCPYYSIQACGAALCADALYFLQTPKAAKITGGTLQLLGEAQDLAMQTLTDLTDTINMLNITMRDAQASKEEARK